MTEDVGIYTPQVKEDISITMFLLQHYVNEVRRLQNIEKFMKAIGAW